MIDATSENLEDAGSSGPVAVVGASVIAWVRATIIADVVVRLAVLAALVYMVWDLGVHDEGWNGLIAPVVVPPGVLYACWQVTALIIEVPLVWRRWESAREARRSVVTVAIIGLPRLVWAVPLSRGDGAAWVPVAITSVTLLVALTATTVWWHLRRDDA